MVTDPLAAGGQFSPQFLTPAPGGVYFVAYDVALGWELWWSDGTAAGTHLVVDLLPGNPQGGDDGGPSHLTWLPSVGLVFAANDGVHGRELWLTEGTAAATSMRAVAWPGPPSGFEYYQPFPGAFGEPVATGGKVFLAANDGVHGRELWVTDGTPAGNRGPGRSPSRRRQSQRLLSVRRRPALQRQGWRLPAHPVAQQRHRPWNVPSRRRGAWQREPQSVGLCRARRHRLLCGPPGRDGTRAVGDRRHARRHPSRARAAARPRPRDHRAPWHGRGRGRLGSGKRRRARDGIVAERRQRRHVRGADLATGFKIGHPTASPTERVAEGVLVASISSAPSPGAGQLGRRRNGIQRRGTARPPCRLPLYNCPGR